MRVWLLSFMLLSSNFSLSQDSVTVASGTNDLNKCNLFLKGEFHERTAENERSFLLLAKYLYTHNNVRYLVFEWGPDFSYLANRYLQTQDDSLLFKNTLYFSKSFWDTIVSCNRLKSASDKIKIAGFDFNRSMITAKAFSEMMKGKAPFPGAMFRSAIQNIISWKDSTWTWNRQKMFVEQMNELRSLCKKQDSALANYFGDDWLSFSAIINNEVESTPMVKRDKKTIEYVKAFLDKKPEGNVLFNLGVNHTYFDGAGMASLLEKDEKHGGKVCSIYPYHRIDDVEKVNYQKAQDEALSASILADLQTAPPYALVSLAQKGIYPKKYKKAQWVYVVPKVK